MPTEEVRAVKGAPMDVTLPRMIGARINDRDPQLQNGLGIGHNFVLNKGR